MSLQKRFRVLLWFAINHSETLTTGDIRERFDYESNRDVIDSLRKVREQDYLVNDGARGPGQSASWSAGPALLREVGIGHG